MEKFALIFFTTTLLLSNFTSARSRWTLRDVLPPKNFLGGVSTFHRPWYAGRREAELPKKVFENAPQNFQVIEMAVKLKIDIKKLSVCNKVMPKQKSFLKLVSSIEST